MEGHRTDASEKKSGETWDEIGSQLRSLGDSLARVFRTAWQDEENRKRLEEMRTGLEAMIASVNQAIRETAQSEEGQQVKEEAENTVRKLYQVGQQTFQEARPHLISALHQLNDELRKMVDRMEGEGK
jgi:ElaB/YqjD/DUF883 family membrane-anchored ribosome-binding protein